MNQPQGAGLSEQCHALNNLFSKILWATELALEGRPPASVRSELEAIVKLAKDGGDLVEALRSAGPEG